MNSRLLLALASLGYLISWFVPVHQEVHSGLEAYWRTAGGFVRLFGEPIEASAILMAISPHTNYVVIGAAIMILRKQRGTTTLRKLRFLLPCCLLCDCIWMTEGSQLRFGYYLWLSAFALCTLAAQTATREEEKVASVSAK